MAVVLPSVRAKSSPMALLLLIRLRMAGISAQVERLDGVLEQVLTRRAETGAVLDRLETTKNHWADFKLNLTESLSDTEDADMTKTLTDLSSQEAAYQASLAAAANVLQVSLLDFLQ